VILQVVSGPLSIGPNPRQSAKRLCQRNAVEPYYVRYAAAPLRRCTFVHIMAHVLRMGPSQESGESRQTWRPLRRCRRGI
jgi:hypothetical protein